MNKKIIVILLPLTGIYSNLGNEAKRAIELYLEKNPSKNVDFIIENTKSNDDTFEHIVKTYICTGVRTFIGGINSREVGVWVDRIQPCYGDIATLLTPSSTEVFDVNSFSVIRIIANNQAAADSIYYWLFKTGKSNGSGSNIGILYFESSYAQNYVDRLKYRLPEINLVGYTFGGAKNAAIEAFTNPNVRTWIVVSLFDQEIILDTQRNFPEVETVNADAAYDPLYVNIIKDLVNPPLGPAIDPSKVLGVSYAGFETAIGDAFQNKYFKRYGSYLKYDDLGFVTLVDFISGFSGKFNRRNLIKDLSVYSGLVGNINFNGEKYPDRNNGIFAISNIFEYAPGLYNWRDVASLILLSATQLKRNNFLYALDPTIFDKCIIVETEQLPENAIVTFTNRIGQKTRFETESPVFLNVLQPFNLEIETNKLITNVVGLNVATTTVQEKPKLKVISVKVSLPGDCS